MPTPASAGFLNNPQEAMNLTTLAEGSSVVLSSLAESGDIPAGTSLDWSGTYSRSGWTFSSSGVMNGSPFNINLSGNLTGNIGQDITVSLAGGGNIGSSIFSTSGMTLWQFDSTTNDYLTMNGFADAKKFSEALVGGLIGGTLGALTGNFLAATVGAIGGAAVGVAWSSALAINDPNNPVPPSLMTIGNVFPGPPFPLDLSVNGAVGGSGAGVAIFPDVNTVNVNFSDTVLSTGAYTVLPDGGQISGTATLVPEPSTLVLFSLGALGVLGTICLRRMRAAPEPVERPFSPHPDGMIS
jgi:hypothetical protein